MLTPDTIWELKCVQELTDEHILQLAVYGWIWKESYVLYLHTISITYYTQKLYCAIILMLACRGPRKLKLLNIPSREVIEIIADDTVLDDLMYWM